MADLILGINGQNYSGWQQIRVRRGIEQLTGSFDLAVTDRWAGQPEPWAISMGDACRLSMGGETVITGFVDDCLPSFDDKTHQLQVVGRDATSDLVDCSAIWKTGEWKDRTLQQIAADLLKPFGLSVTALVAVGAPFKKFSLQEGETVFEAIERAARMRGLLLISDPQGNLVITRAGTERIATALVQGQNILGASATFSLRDRYRDYIVKGSQPGSDWSTPEQNAGPEGKSCDQGIKRHRPLVLIAEGAADNNRLAERAVWEAAVRMGRSARPVIRVQGWQHQDGLWQPNRLVAVDCPYLKLQREMLIAAVDYLKGPDGTTAELELVRPEAFELLPVPEPEGDSTWG